MTKVLPGQPAVLDEHKSVLTVLDRGGKASAKAQHVNNRPKPMAIFYMLAGLLGLGGVFVMLGKYQSPPSAFVVAQTQTAGAPTVAPTATNIVVGALPQLPTVLPLPTAAPTIVLPTVTPFPTMSPTPRPNVLVVLKAYWPSGKNAGNVKTNSGALVTTIENRGAACPSAWPLGTELELLDGRLLVCLDRVVPSCTGMTCPVWVFSRDVKTWSGVVYGWVRLPEKIWSPAALPSGIPK